MINIYVKEENINDSNDKTEVWYLFDIPAIMSLHILKGCILEMKSGEYIVIKGL